MKKRLLLIDHQPVLGTGIFVSLEGDFEMLRAAVLDAQKADVFISYVREPRNAETISQLIDVPIRAAAPGEYLIQPQQSVQPFQLRTGDTVCVIHAHEYLVTRESFRVCFYSYYDATSLDALLNVYLDTLSAYAQQHQMETDAFLYHVSETFVRMLTDRITDSQGGRPDERDTPPRQ